MSDSNRLQNMRWLRTEIEHLNSTVVADLKPFLNPYGHNTFERLPSKPPDNRRDIGVTVTCTCLMTLALTGQLGALYEKKKSNELSDLLDSVFTKLLSFRWASSQLKENNAFTVSLVLRAAGMICETGNGDAKAWRQKRRLRNDRENNEKASRIKDVHRKLNRRDLNGIAKRLAANPELTLRVGDYSATAAIGYWFVDAVANLGVNLSQSQWGKLAQWGASIFRRQVSLISAKHQVLMDPVDLMMATCLCKRLHKEAAGQEVIQEGVASHLPSHTELLRAVELFLKEQGESGIWPKYFPMFHYPGAGSNHCWTFEVLEAALSEFDDLLDNNVVLQALAKAVEWCKRYRLTWRGDGWLKRLKRDKAAYLGWNSGGQQTTLERGEPESWATGVVHMFLARLWHRLSEAIRRDLLTQHKASRPTFNPDAWYKETIDTNIKLLGEKDERSLKSIIKTYIIDPIANVKSASILASNVKRSVLLFGPPGTGKTRFVKAIAQAIGWDFLPINPSVFLEQGMEGIYAQTNLLFANLRDLYRAVVFFDEMDAMLQARVDEGKVQLSVEQQFMTTCMLPHLTDLYDKRQVLFFVATNYGKMFDIAITRPGRFDMLLFLGPPTWKAKRENLSALGVKIENSAKEAELSKKLGEWIPDNHPRVEALNLATIGELRAMLDALCQGKKLDVAVQDKAITDEKLRETVERWEKERFGLCVSKGLKKQYEQEKDTSEIR